MGGRRLDRERGLPGRSCLQDRRCLGVRVLRLVQAHAVSAQRAPRDARLVIRVVHDESRQTDGARRVHAQLVPGLPVDGHSLHRRAGDAPPRPRRPARPARPKFRKIPNTPTAEDLVNRDFARTEPNRLWLTGITEHGTREGKVCTGCGARRLLPSDPGLVDRLVAPMRRRRTGLVDGVNSAQAWPRGANWVDRGGDRRFQWASRSSGSAAGTRTSSVTLAGCATTGMSVDVSTFSPA
jgi:hypothetical protein